MYAESCKPEDAIAAHNWETLRCWSFLDVAVHGRYNALAWAYMQDRGLAPEVQPEDALILQQGRPDFIAINYYSTATIAASRGDGDVAPRAGDQQIMLGEEGFIVRRKTRGLAKPLRLGRRPGGAAPDAA
jgi:6-phospho-beta-glucosidase